MSEELKPCNCREKAVHNAHCCSSCGCKYDDPYCPVDEGIKCQECNENDADIEFSDCTYTARHITKDDVDAYCRDNGLVLVPEETITKMGDLYGILDGTHKRLKHDTEDILGGLIDDIAAFQEQAI